MHTYKYLIIGGGMSADAAVRGIQKSDPGAEIGLLSADSHMPYNLPPLSKGLWHDVPFEKIWRGTDKLNIDIHLGTRAISIDRSGKTVHAENGMECTFDKLLIATGGSPRKLPFGGGDIIYLRYLDHYYRLRKLADQRTQFSVIGGGFIGSEIAASLAIHGKSVTMLFPEKGIASALFPQPIAEYLNDYYRAKGITILPEELVTGLRKNGNDFVLQTRSGKEIEAEGIVAGLGIKPNTEIAEHAGIEVNNGIIVDEILRTSDENIYAAGDVANFYNVVTGKRIRAEHEDNANMMGYAAGMNMAGKSARYEHLPFFYSDLFDISYQAIGDLDPRREIFADWQEEYKKGVLYYLNADKLTGILLWNLPGQLRHAKNLLLEQKPASPDTLKGRLPAGR